jgi:ribosomal protein L16 Arg81 hydroxylase
VSDSASTGASDVYHLTGFAEALGDVSETRFIDEFWDRQPLLVPGSPVARGLHLDQEQMLDLYAQLGMEDEDFTSYHSRNASREDGRRRVVSLLSEHRDPANALSEFNRGNALIVRRIQRYVPEVADLIREWSDFFDCRVSCNAYMTYESSSAFPEHYDQHHVFAVQTFGAKRWLLGPPTVSAPLGAYEFVTETGCRTLEREHTTNSGDMLYIPWGWHHLARAASTSFPLKLRI